MIETRDGVQGRRGSPGGEPRDEPAGHLAATSHDRVFGTERARALSTYAGPAGDKLVRVDGEAADLPPLVEFVHQSVRALVLNSEFPCVGARSAFNRGSYRFALYDTLGSPSTTETLAWDLERFLAEVPHLGPDFTTFIASFQQPTALDELGFERSLWQQLNALHDLDRTYYPADAAVSRDPDAPDFGFSFGGQALFVVGLHAASSRWARRFAFPTLAFNPHEQFTRLRESGRFHGVQRQIQRRDFDLQGSLNPNLADFGERSEARQYSGRAVEEDWSCPYARNMQGE